MGIPGRIGTTRPFAEIARGTTTSVYKAYDEDADRVVAVKLLHRMWLADTDLSSRFLAEADALRLVSDKHVVSILQSGESDEGLFIVTEYVDGLTLDALLQQRTVPSAFALLALRCATAGLAAAHGQGIVHRDFKPANIIVAESGLVQLADFGLAGTTMESREVAGTPEYLAPEVVAGHAATFASDVFSVGVTLFETLAGGLPSDPALGTRSATFQLSRVGESLLATLDAADVDVINQLTSAAPDDRPEHAGATLPLLDNLLTQFQPTPDASLFGAWLAGGSAPAPRRARAGAGGLAIRVPQSSDTPEGVTASEKPRRTVWWAGATAAVVLIAALLALAAWRSSRSGVESTPAPASTAATAATTAATTAAATAAATPPPAGDTLAGGVIPKPAPEVLPEDQAKDQPEDQTDEQPEEDPELVPASNPAENQPMVTAVDRSSNVVGDSIGSLNQPLSATGNQPAFLAVSASPWADVLLDGLPVGTTPITEPLAVDPGTHKLTLRHPDFPDYTRTVEAVAADTSVVAVSMWSTVARVNLTVSPWAEVLIDDAVRDTTPMQSDLIVKPGPARLTLRHPTLGTWSTALDLQADTTYVMQFNLFELTRQ